MKKILFFADIYWELHWMHNVIKALDADVYTTSTQAREYCEKNGLRTTNTREPYQIVVLTNMHLGQQYDMANYYRRTGGKVVLLQHAWDAGLHQKRDFWGKNMEMFDYYLVGCTQDYKWLNDMYVGKIFNTGVPRLDDLYKVKKSKKSLQHIYDLVGTNDFILSMSPTASICQNIERVYDERLEGETPTKIVYKIHPGGNVDATIKAYAEKGRQMTIFGDEINNRLFTYELMKAAKAVVCIESFLSIEASLLEKPVIFYGLNELPSDFYNRSENVNQQQRAPRDMSSTFADLSYKPRQKEIADMYQFDGMNTDRVVKKLMEISAL